MTKINPPQHIGYIIDGNRRWAKSRGLTTAEGHLAGYNAISDVAKASFDVGVEYVSVYVFSTENWKRSEEEVGYLMKLVLRLLTTDLAKFKKNNIKILILGSRDKLSKNIIKAIEKAELDTADNTAGTLCLCFNYGGHQEIVDAVKKVIQSGCAFENVDARLIEQNLYAPEIPLIDLVVRTSGEQRISNFMLWRVAYSEMMFLDKFWPDMTKQDVSYIINEYNNRSRRFGG